MNSDDLKNFEQSFLKIFDDKIIELKRAYEKLQKEFTSINFELDKTNRELKKSLLENENITIKLNNILENISNGVIVIDVNGNITHINSKVENLFNQHKDSLVGKNYNEVFSNFNKNSMLTSVLEDNTLELEGEKIFEVNGEERYLWYHFSKLYQSDNSVVGAIETLTDITKLKNMEKELLHTSNLAALGEMSATVAHEIRNPLGAVGGYIALLGRIATSQKEKDIIDKIKRAVNSLSRTVENLLNFTRKTVINRFNINLEQFLKEFEKNIEFEIDKSQKNIKLNIIKNCELDFFHFDRDKIEQVLLNLCLNAIQAIDSEGEISIVLDAVGNELKFDVIDSQGTLSNIESVFNPFYTTKENGTGLGLAISKKIVQLHGGDLICEVEKDKFTKFSLTVK